MLSAGVIEALNMLKYGVFGFFARVKIATVGEHFSFEC